MATLVKPATRVAAQCTNALALAGATTVRPIRSKHRRMTLGWEFISGMNLLGQRIGKGGDMKIIPMEEMPLLFLWRNAVGQISYQNI